MTAERREDRLSVATKTRKPMRACRYRLVVIEVYLPDLAQLGALLSPLERDLLDGLARIIAADMLRRRKIA